MPLTYHFLPVHLPVNCWYKCIFVTALTDQYQPPHLTSNVMHYHGNYIDALKGSTGLVISFIGHRDRIQGKGSALHVHL